MKNLIFKFLNFALVVHLFSLRALTGKQQLLAVSDSVGTLHILEVPWSLRHATTGEVSHCAQH